MPCYPCVFVPIGILTGDYEDVAVGSGGSALGALTVDESYRSQPGCVGQGGGVGDGVVSRLLMVVLVFVCVCVGMGCGFVGALLP